MNVGSHKFVVISKLSPSSRWAMEQKKKAVKFFCWEMILDSIHWSMMSRACGATLLRNGDSWRASLRPKGLAGVHPLSVKSGFYKQVESAREWHERSIAYWWKHCGVAGLDYYSEPASAASPTCSTLGVSGRSRDIPWHVNPSRGRRTNHFPSIYPHPGGCQEEGRKKRKQGDDNALIG